MGYIKLLAVALMLAVVRGDQPIRHSWAEIFNGALSYVNTTTLQPSGEWINLGLGKIGNIIYAPAFPGALYGNMTVAYGTPDLPQDSTCMAVLSDFSGYTGGYEVFPDKEWVEHYPLLNSNAISGQTPAGAVHVRRVHFHEDDNLIAIGNNLARQRLYWRRNNLFSALDSACTVSASISAVGNSWVSGGKTFQQYSLTVSNVGDRVVTAAEVQFSFGGDASIDSAWNMAKTTSGTDVYSVAIPAGIVVGGSSQATGFIAKGSGSITVGVPSSATLCN